MADGDSVGRISLDMEVDGDLGDQISKAAEQIGERIEESLKNVGNLDFSEMAESISNSITEAIDNSMKSIQGSIESTINKALANVPVIRIPVEYDNLTNSPKIKQNTNSRVAKPRAPPTSRSNTVNLEAVKAQIDSITKSLDITNSKIELQMAKLAELKESYNMAFDGARKNQLQEQILNTEEKINKLIATSDKAGFKLADLDEQFQLLSNAAKDGANGLNEEDKVLQDIANRADRVSNSANKASSSLKKIGDSAKSSGNASSSAIDNISRMLDRMMLRMVLMNTIIKGLTDMFSYIGSAFMTNQQFANSLLQIKSNLEVAFQPIYQAVLPAINSLVSALATATAYIASFLSEIFGTTYQQSFNSASAMQKNIGAMNQTEKAAKKTADSLGSVGSSAKKATDNINQAANASKKGLAGFDAINKLGSTSGNKSLGSPAGDGVETPITPMANMGPIEAATQGWADKFKNLLAGLWEPFKEAWAEEGQNTINAAKHALQGIEDLLGAIGKSFYTVWTNGTGERILVNLLKILQGILNIIGDIGVTFANAWNKGDIGTQVVQHLANAFNNVLSLIAKMLQSIRNVWAEEGPSFANIFMQALNATTIVIENVTQKLGWIWDHGGQHAFEGLVKLGLKVGELALYIYTNFVAPFVNWFVNTISPAIAKVLDVLGSLFNKLSVLVDYLKGDGYKYTKLFLELFAAGKIISFINNIAKSTVTIIANTTAKVANTLATDSNNVAENAGIIAKAKEIAINIQLIALYLKDAIAKGVSTAAQVAQTIAQTAQNVATTAWSVICGIATVATTAFGVAVAFLTSPITLAILAIAAIIAIGVLLYQNWDTIKAKAIEIWDAIKAKFAEFKDWLGNVFSTDWSQKFGWMGDILNGFLANIRNIFSGVSQIFQGIIDFIAGVFTGNWSQAWRGIVEIFGGIFSTISAIAKAPLNALISLVNAAISGLNQLNITLPDFMGGGSFGFHIPKIPYLAKGGIVNSPTLSMIGEAGTEAVVPLENNTGGLDLLAQKISQRMSIGVQQPTLTMVGNGGSQVNSSSSNEDFKQAVIEAIVEALKDFKSSGNGQGNNSSSNGDLVFKINESQFGKIAISAINKVQRQAGVTLIKV